MTVLRLEHASLAYGGLRLWTDLGFAVEPGEFLAVLGGNGTGKTSLLRVALGLQPLSGGRVLVDGRPPTRGSDTVGYLPQRASSPPLPLRARDLVGAGLDGHRWFPGRSNRATVDTALREVGAAEFADQPFGRLSGGQQQRVRIAQALVGDPRLLLCDELLTWLDPAAQHTVTALVDQRRRQHSTAVVFVTHDVNPVLPFADRVLYLARGGRYVLGTPAQVLTTETLTELHGAPVHVVRAGDRLVLG